MQNTNPFIFATEVAPRLMEFDPNSFATEEEMLSAAKNLYKQATQDIVQTRARRAQ